MRRDTTDRKLAAIAVRATVEAFDRTETGWRLHGHTARWVEIAAEWGTREYWRQWRGVLAPALLIGVLPSGQDADCSSVVSGGNVSQTEA